MEAPEGWYPDPEGIAEERFWDGSTWTQKTRQTPSAASETTSPVDNPVDVPAPAAQEAPRHSVSVESHAAVTTMEYLRSISLVVLSGVIFGLFAGAGLVILSLLPDEGGPQVLGVVLISAGGLAAIVMLIIAIVAADEASQWRTKTHHLIRRQ